MRRNMKTSAQQTLPFGEGASTYLPEDSLASHSVQAATGGGLSILAICGPKCIEQYARLTRIGLSQKTFPALLIGRKDWYSNVCVPIWKLRGTKSGRLIFQLVASARSTPGDGYGLLPTPCASDFQRLRFTTEQLRKSKFQQNVRCLHLKLLSLTTFGQNRINTGLLMGYPKDWTNVPSKPTATP